MFHLRSTIPKMVVVMCAVLVLTLTSTDRVLANDSVMGAATVSVPQSGGDPLMFEFSVAAVGPGGGPAQGAFRACIHDPAGDINLSSEIQSVGGPPNGSRIVLGGLGSVEQNGFGQLQVPWHLSVVQNQGGVEATLSVTSSLFGHISHAGTIVLGSVERTSSFPSGMLEAVAACGSGNNTAPSGPPGPDPTQFMTFEYAAFVGSSASDGFGSFAADVSSTDCPDVYAVTASFDDTSIVGDPTTEVIEIELSGPGLVYLSSDPNNPVSREVTVTFDRDEFGDFAGTTLEIIGVDSEDPVQCSITAVTSRFPYNEQRVQID